MRSPIIMAAIISFLLSGAPSCSGRLLENNLFIASDNPSVLDPDHLSSILDTGSHLQKDAALHCDQEIKPWSSSSEKNATKLDENELSIRPNPMGFQNKSKENESPASNKAESVFHLLPKRRATPSGVPSPKVNSIISEQRLSTSKRSPGVGHLQMVRPKSQTIDGVILKSHHSIGVDKRNKRKLRSTPSQGAGH